MGLGLAAPSCASVRVRVRVGVGVRVRVGVGVRVSGALLRVEAARGLGRAVDDALARGAVLLGDAALVVPGGGVGYEMNGYERVGVRCRAGCAWWGVWNWGSG